MIYNEEENAYQYGMEVLQANSLRELVDKVNDNGVMKEDIVKIMRDNENYFLLYYK